MFKESNPELPEDFYGESLAQIKRQKNKEMGPKLEDYNLPRNETEWDMWSKMKECGSLN